MLSLWIESLYQASTPTAIVILTALNCAQFGISIGLGALLSRWSAPIAPHLGIANLNDLKTSDPQKREVVLIILLNSLVAIIGWILWREGWIEIELESSWPQRCFDLMILTLMMDLVMYITHRIAHIPILYSLVHDKHHQAEHAHPLDLFYLSPIEVI